MKWIKYSLALIIFVSALFQVLIGCWILLDLTSAGSMLLGIKSNSALMNSFEFGVLAKIAGKSFIMLFVYSLVTCYLVIKEKNSAFIMSLATGLMITAISITTYLDTGSYMVWITDFSRGFLITVFAGFFYFRLKKQNQQKRSSK